MLSEKVSSVRTPTWKKLEKIGGCRVSKWVSTTCLGFFSLVKVRSWSHPGVEIQALSEHMCWVLNPWGRHGRDTFGAAGATCALLESVNWLWTDSGVMVSGQGESWSYKSESINWELFVRSCTSRHLWGHPLSTLCWVTSKVCTEYFPSAAFIVILLGSVKDKDSFQSFQTSRHHCCSQSRDSVANPNVF